MPSVEINRAKIYYETFGKKIPDQPPILLIHGSTTTGERDWGLIAPFLAQRWHVIVPDCRGHGRSENPLQSYRFREMADDMAALVQALGYRQAHIVGHSNGGNVALVTLMEHPEVVQSAVLQAANAYVSPYLKQREPLIFDPDRIEREDPDWKQEMIELHGPTHGQDYWRTLIRLTLQETISQPNYSPAALSRANRAVLVIQGQNDQVNAPDRHAEYLASNIPYAELWTPTNVGHNVHKEIPLEWLQRLEEFLTRRGDDANEALYRLGRDRYSEARSTLFQLRALSAPEKPGIVEITGEVLKESQLQEALEAVQTAQSEIRLFSEKVKILLDENTPWALINRPVDDLRREPHSLAERVSQVLLGEVTRVLRSEGEWSQVLHERHHYLGWVHTNALHVCSLEEAAAYQASCRARVLAVLLPAREEGGRMDTDVGKLPFGTRLPVEKVQDGQSLVRLPDGRLWWVESAGLLPLELSPTPNAAGISFGLEMMKRFIGVPYLWGGRSPYGFDCSGFSGAFWDFLGVNLPRDADQQFQAGHPADYGPEPGDLVFFGSLPDENVDRRQQGRFASITNVAISLGEDELIHANGAAWGVSINSLNPSSALFNLWLRDHLIGFRRFV